MVRHPDVSCETRTPPPQERCRSSSDCTARRCARILLELAWRPYPRAERTDTLLIEHREFLEQRARLVRAILGSDPVQVSKRRVGVEPERAAKVGIARAAKPSAAPGHLKLVLTLDLRRALAGQLSVQVIRQDKNLERIVIEILEAARDDTEAIR